MTRTPFAKGFENIAKAYLALNDAATARKFAEQALALRQAHPRRRYLYDTYYLLGDIAAATKDWDAALENIVNRLRSPRLTRCPHRLMKGKRKRRCALIFSA